MSKEIGNQQFQLRKEVNRLREENTSIAYRVRDMQIQEKQASEGMESDETSPTKESDGMLKVFLANTRSVKGKTSRTKQYFVVIETFVGVEL